MNFFSKIALGIVAVALLASCVPVTDSTNKPTTNTGTTTTKKLVVDLPKSLTTTTTPSASVSRAGTSSPVSSIGYEVIKMTVNNVKGFMPFMAIYGTLIDAVVAQNSLSPSSATIKGKTLKVTQAMVDNMKASMDSDLLNASSLPAVGSDVSLPDFVYNTSANTHFSYSFGYTDTAAGYTNILYWNADKTKFGMEMTMSGMSLTLANDNATASTVMKLVSAMSTNIMKLKADTTAAATQGVYVGLDATSNGSTMAIAGWADDNGGAVKFDSSGSNYTEEFTGAGVLSYQAYSSGGVPAVNLGTTPTAAYATKLGNTAWGDALTFFP